jgi:replicative DNA helicase
MADHDCTSGVSSIEEGKCRQKLEAAAHAAAGEDSQRSIERYLRFRGTSLRDPGDPVIELQVLEAMDDGRYARNYFAHATSDAALVVLLSQADNQLRGSGTYYVPNEINPAVRARAKSDEWHVQQKSGGTSDADVLSRRVLYFDCDVRRPKGISSTEAERELAFEVAVRIYAWLSAALGSDDYLGVGLSGNGYQVHVALDSLPNDAAVTAQVRALLLAAKYIFSTSAVDIDVSVSDPKRLCPAFGTMKRKGIDDPERPHRRTWFWCEESVRRLTAGELERLVGHGVARLTPEQTAAVDKILGKKSSPSTSGASTSAPPSPEASSPAVTLGGKTGPFAEANAVPVEDVAGWLSITQDGYPICPGCGTTGDSSVAFVANGLKCLHSRCAEKGRAGFRTVVDLVAEVKGVKPVEAVRLLAEQFDLPADLGNSASTANTATTGEASPPFSWVGPVPFDGSTELPSFPTYALPGWARAWVEAEALATQTPVDLAAMTVVGVLSTACAKKFKVQVREGWLEPMNVYEVVALNSGNRKSAVLADAKKPLNDYENELTARAEVEVEKCKSQRAILDGRLKHAVSAASKDKTPNSTKEAEAQELAARLSQAKVPELPRLLVGDVTTEKLAVVMAGQGGRIAMFSAEGGIFEIMGGRYSDSANYDLYLQAHSGDDVRVDRIGRESLHLRAPALTMTLTVQPDVVRGLVGKPGFRGRGLIARLLFSMPVSLVGRRQVDPPPVPEAVRKAYEAGVDRLLREPTKYIAGDATEIEPTVLTLSAEARDEMNELLRQIEPWMGPGGHLAHMADWLGKLAGAVARIAALIHLAEFPANVPIGNTTMTKAQSVGYYLLAHARVAFEHMQADPAVADAKYVLEVLKRDGRKTLSQRDIFERTKGRFGRVAELEEVLVLLVERGYLRKCEQARQGAGRPPSPLYEVNPLWGSQNSRNSHKSPAQGPVAGSASSASTASGPAPSTPPPSPGAGRPQPSPTPRNYDLEGIERDKPPARTAPATAREAPFEMGSVPSSAPASARTTAAPSPSPASPVSSLPSTGPSPRLRQQVDVPWVVAGLTYEAWVETERLKEAKNKSPRPPSAAAITQPASSRTTPVGAAAARGIREDQRHYDAIADERMNEAPAELDSEETATRRATTNGGTER